MVGRRPSERERERDAELMRGSPPISMISPSDSRTITKRNIPKFAYNPKWVFHTERLERIYSEQKSPR